MRTMALPDDLALVRVDYPGGSVAVFSDRLTELQAEAADAIAVRMVREGASTVVVRFPDLPPDERAGGNRRAEQARHA